MPLAVPAQFHEAVYIAPSADIALSVVSSSLPDMPIVGNPISYTVVVTNNGPGRAQNVGLTFATDNLTNVSFAGACTAMPCVLPTLGVHSSVALTIGLTPSTSGNFGLRLIAASNVSDPDPANNDLGANASAVYPSTLKKDGGPPRDVVTPLPTVTPTPTPAPVPTPSPTPTPKCRDEATGCSHRDAPVAIGVGVGVVLLVLAAAIITARRMNERRWIRRTIVVVAVGAGEGSTLGAIPFSAPPLSLTVSLGPVESGPAGSIPITRVTRDG